MRPLRTQPDIDTIRIQTGKAQPGEGTGGFIQFGAALARTTAAGSAHEALDSPSRFMRSITRSMASLWAFLARLETGNLFKRIQISLDRQIIVSNIDAIPVIADYGKGIFPVHPVLP